MTVALLALAYVLVIAFAVSLCAVAGRSDRRIEGWRNRETP